MVSAGFPPPVTQRSRATHLTAQTWGFAGSSTLPPNTWAGFNVPYQYTFGALPFVVIGGEYAYGETGHIQNGVCPETCRGIGTTIFTYSAYVNPSGYIGVEWFAVGPSSP